MNRYRRHRFVGRPRQTNWAHIRLVASMLIILFIIAGFGYWSKVEANNQEEDRVKPVVEELIKAQQTASESAQLAQDLKDKLERSATYQTPENVKELSRVYLRKYFGKDATTMEKVVMCESGLDPRRSHTNKPGLGADFGLYQINDKWHKDRFEKMYGVPFEVGVYDLDLSSKYAKFLFDHNRYDSWVCADILNIK